MAAFSVLGGGVPRRAGDTARAGHGALVPVDLPGGRPVFDGYLVGNPGDYLALSSSAPGIVKDDPRQRVEPLDVPVITLLTGPQEDTRRRADGSSREDRYRVYEVAGASTAAPRAARAYGQTPRGLPHHRPVRLRLRRQPLPPQPVLPVVAHRPRAWASKGVTPPPSQQTEREADGTAKIDEYGIPLGGVRSTYSDLPTERYFANTTDECYKDAHVKKVVRQADSLERRGWLLAADAREIRQEAAAVAEF